MESVDDKTQGNDGNKSYEKSTGAKFGKAILKDHEALFEGSEGRGLISINGNYYNTVYGEDINIGNSLPGF